MNPQRWGLLALMAVMVACRGATEPDSRPVVAVSVLPQAFFVEQIAADRVSIAVMIPPGANPSTVEPSIDALTSFSGAALYVAVGHPHFAFETAWIGKLLSEQPRLEVIRGTGAEGDGSYDPTHLALPETGSRAGGAHRHRLAKSVAGKRGSLAGKPGRFSR